MSRRKSFTRWLGGLLVLSVIAVMLVLPGCGQHNPLSPVSERGMSVVKAARLLSAGPADTALLNQLYLWSEDQRRELRQELQKRMSATDMAQREDIFSIIGPTDEIGVPIDELMNRDQIESQRIDVRTLSVQEYIAVGGLPQFSQNDPLWKYKKLGFSSTSTIGRYGCYLCCISMLTRFWGYGVNPPIMNDWRVGTRYHYIFAYGTDWIRLPQAVEYPYICRPWSYIAAWDFEKVRRQLRAGKPVVVKTDWFGSHFMLVYCWDGTQFWVLDPWPYGGSLCRPLTSYYGSILEFRLLGYYPS